MKVKTTFKHEDVLGFKLGSQPIGPPKMFSHIYFFDGLLVDTGHIRMRAEAMNYLQDLPVNQIVLTHHHEDHSGNLDAVMGHFQCNAFASSQCIELMKNPPDISLAQWLIWGRQKPNFELQEIRDKISTDQYELEVLHLPGHSDDMIGLYSRNHGWLFSADLWVSEYIKFFMRTESVRLQIESLKKVLQYDFDVIFCGHNPQFRNGKEKMRRKLEFMENFYGKVAEKYQSGLSDHAILKEINMSENWGLKLLSGGELSAINMVRSVIRDEQQLSTAN